MRLIKLLNLMGLWFGADEAERAWGAAWRARQAKWGAKWELEHISHMQTSLAILYREKWGGHEHG